MSYRIIKNPSFYWLKFEVLEKKFKLLIIYIHIKLQIFSQSVKIEFGPQILVSLNEKRDIIYEYN